MKFMPLGEMDLVYVGPSLTYVDYGSGGQYYAALEGTWHSDRLSGKLRLTNLAPKRADDVNVPTLSGVLETDDGATMFVEMNGLSQMQHGGRVFVASVILRTASPRYTWVNTLFAVVEGLLLGPPKPNEFRAHCNVYACEATIAPGSEGGNREMQSIAYALPVLPNQEETLQSFVGELRSRATEHDALRRETGVSREVAYLQRTPEGSLLLLYRELEKGPGAAAAIADGEFQKWMGTRMAKIHGFDPTSAAAPPVEVMLRHRARARGSIYLAALPLAPGKAGRLHEFASELNGIHAAEYEESLRRLGIGLTLFLQHTPQIDLTITAVEGAQPLQAFGALMASQHPFDRWHMKQIADLHGVDLTGPPPPPNQELWSWEQTAVPAR